MPPPMLLGIFVGGTSSRMEGRPKGLLMADAAGERIVGRWLRLARLLELEPAFVGNADAYSEHWPSVRCIADVPLGVGPLGGLAGLLAAAGDAPVLAVACDMPYVSLDLLKRLVSQDPKALVVASKTLDGRWDPFCARYDPAHVRPHLDSALASGVRSFQWLFNHLRVCEFVLDESERAELTDWDTPGDIVR